MKNSEKISHLKHREIQAPVVLKIVDDFIKEFGEDATLKVLSETIKDDAIKSGTELAERYKGNGIGELSKLIKEVWCEDGAMEIEILKETETEFHFNVTRCKYAEIYQKLNNPALGKYLSCNRDFPFNTGFNPDITLKRSKTIMEGFEICDFRYSLKQN